MNPGGARRSGACGLVARLFDRCDLPERRGNDLAMPKVGQQIIRAPLICAPDTSAIEAACIMHDAHASSLGVVQDGRLVGLVTIRDMSSRVVAEGRDVQAPVGQVMTADPITLSPGELGYDVLNIMLERCIGHLPVVEGDRFVGMVSQTDLMRVQAISSSALIRDIAGAENVAAMVASTARIPELLVQLVSGHYRHEVVTRMITDIADAVTRRLLIMAEAELGEAPGRYLWAACGSQGRQEQTGLSDQDNCLILEDGCDRGHPWFADLARFVSDGLHACGYVYCPGDMMATNPRWRQPRRVWRGYFRDWILHPSPETLEMAARNSIFVAHMVSNALKHRPPLGLIGGFATIRTGEHRHRIDMKHSGMVPVIDLARIYALQGRLRPVNTRAGLTEAEDRGVISGSGARDLLAAYDLIQTTRLENQAEQIRAGRRPDNYLDPAGLPDFGRSHLRDAFVVVRGMQSAVGHGKGMLG